jgi:hypothetical protein
LQTSSISSKEGNAKSCGTRQVHRDGSQDHQTIHQTTVDLSRREFCGGGVLAGFRDIGPHTRLRMSGSIEMNSPSIKRLYGTISPHPVARGSLIVAFFHVQGNGLDPSGLQFCERCRIGTKAFREKQKWIYWDTFCVEHVSTKKEPKG